MAELTALPVDELQRLVVRLEAGDAPGRHRAALRGGGAAARRDRRAAAGAGRGQSGRAPRVPVPDARDLGPGSRPLPRAGSLASMADRLVVRGAREHNLRDVSLDLPRDRLIVFTGLSGSGKSSLAFDTIYAEGQRRYVESLSSYARQFLGQMDKPDVDFIEGLSPAISIDQKSASRNPRSTVGTVTEIYDYLRLLYARVGKPHCPNCGRPVARQTPQQIVDRILDLPEGTRFQVLAPVVRGRKGEYEAFLDDLAKQGFARARVDGETVELSEPGRAQPGPLRAAHHRGGRRPAGPARRHPPAADRVDGDGAAAHRRHRRDRRRSARTGPRSSSPSPSTWPAPTAACRSRSPRPRNFSFNSPYGACPACDGLGTQFEVDPDLVVPDPSRTPVGGGHRPVDRRAQPLVRPHRRGGGRVLGFGTDDPLGEAARRPDRKVLLYGSGQRQVTCATATATAGSARSPRTSRGSCRGSSAGTGSRTPTRCASGPRPSCARCPCPTCDGARLKPESLAVTVGGPQHLRAVQPVDRPRRRRRSTRSS